MKKILIATAISSLFMAGAAQAGTATATMGVSATVNGTCKITTAPTPMAFGIIDPSTVAANVTASSSFLYKCTTGLTPLSLADDGGLNKVGVQSNLASGALRLKYGYTYPATPLAAGTGFGSGSTATTVAVAGTILMSDAQNAAAGVYADTVTFTLTF